MGEECWLFNRAWGKDRDDTRKLEIVIPSILDTCVWGVLRIHPVPSRDLLWPCSTMPTPLASRMWPVWLSSGVHTGSQLGAGAGKDLGTEHMPFPGRKSW